ncbi:MAG: 4Fe-4S dicluster domain-containing protein [Dehalococcoidia bacterium]|nr:4Fe-4S dicluster domain-containing protein [Dehalococcoidia bacterium]
MKLRGEPVRASELDPGFKLEVITHGAARDITACFSCGTCTAGCPIHEIFPEFDPRKIARMVNLGMRKRVLSSPYIWYCATCHACEENCPQNVKFFNVLNVLKNMAAKEGYAPPVWVNQTKQVTRTGIVFPTEESWVRKREGLSLRPLKGDAKGATKLIQSVGADRIKPRA